MDKEKYLGFALQRFGNIDSRIMKVRRPLRKCDGRGGMERDGAFLGRNE